MGGEGGEVEEGKEGGVGRGGRIGKFKFSNLKKILQKSKNIFYLTIIFDLWYKFYKIFSTYKILIGHNSKIFIRWENLDGPWGRKWGKGGEVRRRVWTGSRIFGKVGREGKVGGRSGGDQGSREDGKGQGHLA